MERSEDDGVPVMVGRWKKHADYAKRIHEIIVNDPTRAAEYTGRMTTVLLRLEARMCDQLERIATQLEINNIQQTELLATLRVLKTANENRDGSTTTVQKGS